MARGKQAAMSAQRRYETAVEHIDRLTEELANVKVRARDAEARAARLEGADALISRASSKNDELLFDALQALDRWKRVQRADQKRRTDAIVELLQKLVTDLGWEAETPAEDKRQFLETRYPAVMLALKAGEAPSRVARWKTSVTPYERRLVTAEEVRRFQRLTGQRGEVEGAKDVDFADWLNDVLDAKQAGFSAEDIVEYSGVSS
jgi:hypothetical protein